MQEINTQFIEGCFARTTPRHGLELGWYALIGFASAFFIAWVFRRDEWGMSWPLVVALPWFIVLLLLIGGWLTAYRQRRRRRMITKVWENVQLEAWDEAGQTLESAMQGPIRSSNDRCQAFMLLAKVAEGGRQYESAAQIYETLLLERIGDGYQLQQVQLSLSSAKLRNEELVDAVHMLDRLAKVPMPLALQAARELIRLYQQVFMGHYEDAIENISERRSLFRRFLSTRAGYGYGLLAAAYHSLGRSGEAAELWLDATTLIKSRRLVEEYGFLSTVSETYPALERR